MRGLEIVHEGAECRVRNGSHGGFLARWVCVYVKFVVVRFIR